MSEHPGKILHEKFMKPLGINANQLAEGLGVNRSTIGRLIAGESNITPRMAARLGALFQVPPRWWLMMQLEFDTRTLSEQPDWSADVTPLEVDPEILLTPKGAMRLGEPMETASQPVSLSMDELQRLPSGPAPERRQVHQVTYASGAVALVGNPS